MWKIVLTDAKMKIMQSVWSDLNALGNIVVVEDDDEDTLVNVKNGDMLESMGKALDRLPYGELPYSLDPTAA